MGLSNEFCENGKCEMGKILTKVNDAMKDAKGIALPGGQDIQPMFYDQEPHPETFHTDDLRRDVYEFIMLYEADLKNLPIFGICRGMQISNVWYGGTLHQHVVGHQNVVQNYSGTKDLKEMARPSILNEVLNCCDGAFCAFSNHHQTIDKIGAGLTVISRMGGEIKALEGSGDRIIVLAQWHPEMIRFTDLPEYKAIAEKLSQGNIDLFAKFVDAVKRK